MLVPFALATQQPMFVVLLFATLHNVERVALGTFVYADTLTRAVITLGTAKAITKRSDRQQK